jgi:hypothetical protein
MFSMRRLELLSSEACSLLGPRASRPPEATGSLESQLNLSAPAMGHSTVAGETPAVPVKIGLAARAVRISLYQFS